MVSTIAWSVFGAVALLIVAFSVGFVLYYRYYDGSTKLTLFVGSMSLICSLLSLFLIPADVYMTSGDNAYSSMKSEMKWTYYGFDIMFMVLLFVAIPFAYFYYEEVGDDLDADISTAQKACNAMKYTAATMTLFGVLVALGALIDFKSTGEKSHDGDSGDEDWKHKVMHRYSNNTAQIVPFCMAVLMCVGLFFSMIYTSWGLAAFPMAIFHDSPAAAVRASGVRLNTGEGSKRSSRIHKPSRSGRGEMDTEEKLDSVRDDIDTLVTKYRGYGDEEWEPADRREFRMLEHRQKALQRELDSEQGSAAKSGRFARWGRGRKGKGKRKGARSSREQRGDDGASMMGSCCAWLWNVAAPIRFVIGILMVAWSCVIVASLLIHLIDQSLNSNCGYHCGFALKKRKIANPIELMLTFLSKYFPLDYVAFGAVIFWLFWATVYGITDVGVRFLFIRLFTLKPHATLHNGLMMAIGFLVFVVASFTFMIYNLAPYYTRYGGKQGKNCKYDTCQQTQVYYLLDGITIGMPIFGLIYFVLSWLFVLVFLIAMLRTALRKAPPPKQRLLGVENDDDLEPMFQD